MTRLQLDPKSVFLRDITNRRKHLGDEVTTLFVDNGGSGAKHQLAVTLFLDYKTAQVTGALVVDLTTDGDTLLVATSKL